MNIVGLLQDSLGKVRSNPIILLPILGATVLIALLSLILVGSLVPHVGLMNSPLAFSPDEAIGVAGIALGRLIALMIVGSIAGLIAHGMTVPMADDALEGRDVHLSTSWQRVKERIVPLLIVSVVVGLLVSLGTVLLVLPGVIVAFFLMFGIVALMLDKLTPLNAIGRSFATVKSNLAAVFVFFLVMIALGVLIGLVNFVLGLIPVVGAILTMVVSSIYASFLSVFVVAVYRGLTVGGVEPPQPEV